MTDFEWEDDTGALDVALDSGTDYASAAIEDYEAGGDPAAIAQTLRDRVGPQHEREFVAYWHESETDEPEPLTAVEYVQGQQLQYRAAVAAAEAQQMLAAKQQQQERAAEQHRMVGEQFEEFRKRSPALPQVESTLAEILSAPTVTPPQTPQEAAAILDVGYHTAIEIERANRKAQVEHEQWQLGAQSADEMWRESFDGEAIERPSFDQLRAKYLSEIPTAKRLDGSHRMGPTDGGVRSTLDQWDADDAPGEEFNRAVDRAYWNGETRSGETAAARHERLTGQKVEVPSAPPERRSAEASFFDDGTIDHAREKALDAGWNL